MNIEYRAPTLLDVEDLSKLGQDTFIATFGHLYSSEDLNTFLERVFHPHVIRNELSNPMLQYRVAEDAAQENPLIGYCKIGQVRVPVVPQGKALELRQLYLRQSYFGRGIASTLMKWAMDQFTVQGAEEVYLSVWSENQRAIRFYERFGFSNVGTYEYMVGNHADHEFIYRRTMP